MAIPQAIKDMIELAKAQESAEIQLEALKNEKITHQTAIASLNAQISDQTAAVVAARLALKDAANNI